MILDNASPNLLSLVVESSMSELGTRLPIYNYHRWWSRRFSAIYRFILSSYLFDEESLVIKAIKEPSIMRSYSKNKIFFEPFAGGGTGLIEGSLAGWDVYGIDVNPVATSVARLGIQIVSKGLPKEFEEIAISVLNEAFNTVKKYWTFNSGVISYVFISRDKIPTWISTKSVKGERIYVLLCPKCYRISESRTTEATCTYCGHEFEVTKKPVVEILDSLPESSPGWKVFSVEIRNSRNDWRKEYVSLLESLELRKFFDETRKELDHAIKEVKEVLSEEIEVFDATRLRREANISKIHELFTPRQLLSFKEFLKATEKVVHKELRLSFLLAASESTKSCSLAAVWNPQIAEPVPAAAIKTYWVPKYTVETNPLAHIPGTLEPLGRKVIASALKTQSRAYKYVLKHGGVSNTNAEIILGDAETANMPDRIDLSVVDPPYGRITSYASLSLIHYSIIKLHEALISDNTLKGIDLRKVELGEVPPEGERRANKLYTILKRIAERSDEKSRIVLMYNNLSERDWNLMFSIIKQTALTPTAIYWVLGETPGRIARSKLRGMYLIILKKKNLGEKLRPKIVFREPLEVVSKYVSLDIDAEEKANNMLLKSLNLLE
ncbi:MAG: hypothetical protein QXZ48_08400 [Zestosphaera sp.]